MSNPNAPDGGGAMLGGLIAGPLERRFGAGRLLASSWSLVGMCTLGIAGSTWLLATMLLEFVETGALTAGMIVHGAITIAAVPEQYRGRIFGIVRGMSVVLIPMSALAGGWIAEFVDIWIMFAFAGAYVLGVALLAWANPHVRGARI